MAKELINQVTEFIKAATPSLKDEETKQYFVSVLESAANAEKHMADNEEKEAILVDALVRWANQLAFTLFRENGLTKELEDAYRAIPEVVETTAAVEKLSQARRLEIERINIEQAEIMRQEKGIGIFRAIVGGMSEEEAKKKLEEYDKQVQAAVEQTKVEQARS